MIDVAAAQGRIAEDEAAAIWSRAVACRDALLEPPDHATSIGDLQRRLMLDGATLLIARHDEIGSAVGFAVVASRTATLELFYLAVDPPAWGQGVAGLLLRAVDDHAVRAGITDLELWVIADNDRALATYRHAGWTLTGERQVTASGRTERRLIKSASPARAGW